MYDPDKGYPRIVPYVLYRDTDTAIEWLESVLEMRLAVRFKIPNGPVAFAELLKDGYSLQVGLREVTSPTEHGNVLSMTLIFVDNVDATCERARAAGGSVIDEPTDNPWGTKASSDRRPSRAPLRALPTPP